MKKSFPLVCALLFLMILSVDSMYSQQKSIDIIPLYPQNHSLFVSKNSSLIFTPYHIKNIPSFIKNLTITVLGSRSGIHHGDMLLLSNKNRIVFKPHHLFLPGEKIEVTIKINTRTVTAYSFTISPKKDKLLTHEDLIRLGYLPLEESGGQQASNTTAITSNQNLPSDFPGYYISAKSNPGNGYYFLNAGTRDTSKSCYNLIIDTTGFPVFYQRFPPHHRENFFTYHPSVQLITYYDNLESQFKAYNNSFTFVRNYNAQNGYSADIHELILNEDGSYWLLAYDAQTVDMSQIYPGGCTSAIVVGTIIQGIDSDDHVFFQWSSWDHFNILDADTGIIDLTKCLIDYCHGNALSFDSTGNVILSSRNMSEITKIDRQTGDIIWRWGGSHNQFAFVNDSVPFKAQHHIRYLGNHEYSMFDNGNSRTPPYSRAITYFLNEENYTATLIRDFQKNNPADFTPFMGSHQTLEEGVHLVGWAANYELNVLTQYASDGDIQFEIMSTDTFGVTSYRALKFQWETSLFDFDKDTIDFGSNIPVGQTALATVCISNPSDTPVSIDGFNATDSSFSIENELPFTLAANSCDSLTVAFTPSGTAPVSAVLSVYHAPEDTIRIAKQIRVMGGGIIDRIISPNNRPPVLTITPNPTRGNCTVSFQDKKPIQRLFVYTVNGELLKTINPKGKTETNIKGLRKGTYFIKVYTRKGETATGKLSVL